ncbi:hypothetical protein A8F94_16495 [Bacillus sp. FJAT-27225]|uniref:A24 family peptidase n=1 Tax=Bacillus sp. FJAT-27225 TaxID=1743144 RepID=UPI00080C2114|nr:prepilin peptidase [Bacillus sp. FJAT-27225]OCA84310.1 hypothetical protein A8F94_16495 [Bacillus sp. FJAT-27225]
MINAIMLFLLLVICVITDMRERKIYNVVLFPFLLIALIVNSFTGGVQGLGDALLGMLIGLGILLIPYLMGGMGAGDVKLLAVIGALMGPEFVFLSAVYMALVGGAIAILVILFKKGAKERIRGMVLCILGLLNGLKLPLFQDKAAMQATYPYGVAIAAGATIQFFQAGMLP